MFRLFQSSIQKYPLLTNMITAGGLCCFGDVVAQRILEQNSKHDFIRTARMTGFGILFWAPITTYCV
jgi:hypothetical protein